MSELPVDDLLSVDQAIQILDDAPLCGREVEMDLNDPSLIGSRLVEDIRADRDYPPFDKSLMDGFAVRSSDRGERRVTGFVAAGNDVSRVVAEAGTCVAIMTGAPVPDGFDSVVPIEQTDAGSFKVETIRLNAPMTTSRYIAPRGVEARRGAVVLAGGTVVVPAVLGALATVGASRVRVIARPRVGILTTGDEIVDPALPIGVAQIRNSNGILLTGLIRALGAEPVALGHVRDDPNLIRQAAGGANADILLVTGGMSMGAHDYVPRVLLELGYELKITKLKIKPGKPFVFGVAGTADAGAPLVFGLPGNPVSGFVCTLRLISRILRRIQGLEPEPRWIRFTLSHDLPANGPREFYQPMKLTEGRGEVFSWKGSADLFTLAQANALLARKENEPARVAGEIALALEIPS